MNFMVNRYDPAKGEAYATAKRLGQDLPDNCCGVVGQPPLYKDGEYVFPKYASNLICLLGTFPTATHTEITEKAKSQSGECVQARGVH
jgi:fatty acid synthase subunit alpha